MWKSVKLLDFFLIIPSRLSDVGYFLCILLLKFLRGRNGFISLKKQFRCMRGPVPGVSPWTACFPRWDEGKLLKSESVICVLADCFSLPSCCTYLTSLSLSSFINFFIFRLKRGFWSDFLNGDADSLCSLIEMKSDGLSSTVHSEPFSTENLLIHSQWV